MFASERNTGTRMPARKEAPITVAIVEAHCAVREALAHLVALTGEYTVVLACAPDDTLEALLRATPPAGLVLVGVPHAGAPGLGALAQVAQHWRGAKVLVYTASDEEGLVLRAHRAGARAVLHKGCSAMVLMHALSTVSLVGVFLDEMTQRILLENPDGLSPEERRRERIRAQVTEKLMPVLVRICRGDDPTYEVLAEELRMSRRTVEGYAGDLFEIFGVHSKTALALAAVRVGIVRV